MRRGSLFGPLLVIGVGCVLLAANLDPDLNAVDLFIDHWPWLLVAWGAFHLLERAVSAAIGARLPRPLGGGALVLALLLCVGGSVARAVRGGEWRSFGGVWLERLGQSRYSIPFDELRAEPEGADRLIIQGLPGDIHVVGVEDAAAVRVTGRRQVLASNREEAARAVQGAELKLSREGEGMTLAASAQDRSELRYRLAVEIPSSWSLGVGQSSGRLRADGLDGDVTFVGSGDLHAGDIAGVVRAQLRRGGEVVFERVGAAEMEGSADEIRGADVAGPVRIRGGRWGRVRLQRLGGRLEMSSRGLKLVAGAVPGRVELDDGRLTVAAAADLELEARRRRRIRIMEPVGRAEVVVQRGHLLLEPGAAERLEARVERGDIEARLPVDRPYSLEAVAGQGRITSELASDSTSERPSELRSDSPAGPGPVIRLETRQGDIRLLPAEELPEKL